MNLKISDYKKIIAALLIVIVGLFLSNYSALRRIDLMARGPRAVENNLAEDLIVEDKQVVVGVIVLVIDDFGYRNDNISDGFLELDIPITCAIIPGHSQSQKFSKKAKLAGKEVIIHMPMESTVRTPGEEAFKIKTGMTSEEIEWRIGEVLKEMPEAIGMNNHQGSKATTNGKVMSVVASVLKKNKKFFIDSRTSSETVAEKAMRTIGVPTVRRHIFLDNDISIKNISTQLSELAKMARKKGMAVGIGHAKANTLTVLKTEIPKLLNEGFEFKFASEVVD